MVNQPVASVVLPVSLRDAWPYFREPDLILEWHGWEYGAGGLDKEIKQIYLDEARVGEDHRRIHFGTHFFDFDEEADATRVDVHRAPSSEDAEWRESLPDIDEGWLSFLQQLRFRLERHQADSRRTIFVSGTPGIRRSRRSRWSVWGRSRCRKSGRSTAPRSVRVTR